MNIEVLKREKYGGQRVSVANITFDSSYPSGGETLDTDKVGVSLPDLVLISPSAGYQFEYDYVNNKIKVLTPTVAQSAHSHTENTAATYTQNAATATAGAVTASTGAEVANGTNLSAVTARVIVFGV